MNELTKINRDQRLYVLTCGEGYSCRGFDSAERLRVGVLNWLGRPVEKMRKGTKRHYAAYRDAMRLGAEHNRETGERCDIELTPELIGLERARVVVSVDGKEVNRFWVGKSVGWLPCHLEIKTRRSYGGAAVYLPAGSKVQTLRW